MYCPPPEMDQRDIKKRPPHLLPRTPTVLPYHVSDTVPVDNPLSFRLRPPGASPVLPTKVAPAVPPRGAKPMIGNPPARSANPLPKPKPKPLPRPPSLEKRVPQPIPNYTDAFEGMLQIPSLRFFYLINVNFFLCTIFMIELLLFTINTVMKNNKNVFIFFY